MACILALESSCDDTSAAIIKNGILLSNRVAGQEVHAAFGGVVPELASRAHHENLIPVVQMALQDAQMQLADIDAFAVTAGPGLMGSLLVGTSFIKGLALSLNKPLLAVNHMHAHILAHFIDAPQPTFPFLCLTVSGGHTQLVLMHDFFELEIIGQTIDDAAGEAFDKTAKLLGLPYPGGPLIDRYARLGNAQAFQFAKPQLKGFDYSFSGLKTSIMYFLQKKWQEDSAFSVTHRNDLCASVERTIVDILLDKLALAADHYGVTEIALAGGVSANTGLRTALQQIGVAKNWKVHIPDFQYCTDNAGMIAMAAHFQFERNMFSSQQLTPNPRLALLPNEEEGAS